MKKDYIGYRQHGSHGKTETLSWDDLSAQDVIIEVQFSSVNYKDALAVTNKGQILRRFPLVPGIDAAGVVVVSKTSTFRPGDSVLVTGCGIGENQDGGFAQFLGVAENCVVPLPPGLSLEEAMILGTAGFTAALSLYRLEQNGQTPQKGPILVTGATGGVGCFAVDILSHQGYEVWAVSGKTHEQDWLESLGARRVLTPSQLELGSRPLESARFAGAIDNIGGDLLSGLLRHVDLWGNVASVGLAGGAELKATVMPMILRGVSLLGISSNNCPFPLRLELWRRLAGLWKPRHLKKIHSQTIGLFDLPLACEALISRQNKGRILVNLQKGMTK